MIPEPIESGIAALRNELRQLRADLTSLASARSARATTITDGDLTIANEGNLNVIGTGSIWLTGLGKFVTWAGSKYGMIAQGVVSAGTYDAATQEFLRPSTQLIPEGFLADRGGGKYVVVKVDEAGDGVLAATSNKWRISHTTTSSAANTRLEADGLLARSTSSLRYKQDIEAHTIDPDALLSIRPVTWRDRAQVAEDPECGDRYFGVIAEELDDLGLVELVEYDHEGRPDAVAYSRLAVALVPIIRDLVAEVAALKVVAAAPTAPDLEV